MQQSKVSGRLESSLSPEIQELISIPRLKRELAPAFPGMVQASAAHLAMLYEMELLDGEDTASLAEALSKMKAEGSGAIEIDPSLEDAYFNIEARIMHHAGREKGGKLHIARSRNDLGATVDRMRARETVLRAVHHGLEVLDALIVQGRSHSETVMTGYTHLQPAQPVTFGYYFLGIASALQRDLCKLKDSWPRINQCPMGAGALAGTIIPIDRTRTAQLLGFDQPLPHCLDAVASRDFVIEILSGLLSACSVLSRFAADLHLWTTDEFGLLDFPDSLAGTSSIMPQKKNLAFLEHIKAKPAHIMAALVSFGASIKAVSFTNTMDGNRESLRMFWEATEEGIAGIRLARLAASAATPSVDRMLEDASKNFSTVTDIADFLAREQQFSFRESHHIVGAVVQEAMKHGMTCDQISIDMVRRAAFALTGKTADISEEQLRHALDPLSSVMGRDVGGGPSPKQSLITADLLTEISRSLKQWLSSQQHALQERHVELWSLMSSYTDFAPLDK